jgi:hypothetical protein
MEPPERVKKNSSGKAASKKLGELGKTEVQGVVELIGDFPAEKFGSANGAKHSGAVLRTETERVVVHLGPVRYFQENDFPVRAGDYLEISGSKVITEDRNLIIMASEVKAREKKLQLRNHQGVPLW